jgi:hypothetical protein
MNLNRLGQDAPYTPPFQPSAPGETFPASREHVLDPQVVKGQGPWTYAMLALAALGIYLLAKE